MKQFNIYSRIKKKFLINTLICISIVCGMVIICKILNYETYKQLYMFYYSEFTYLFAIVPISCILMYLDHKILFNPYVVIRYVDNKKIFLVLCKNIIINAILFCFFYNLGYIILQFILFMNISFDNFLIAVISNFLCISIVNIFAIAIRQFFINKTFVFIIVMAILTIDFASMQNFIRQELVIIFREVLVGSSFMIGNADQNLVLVSYLTLALKLIIIFFFGLYISNNWEHSL